MIQSDEFDLAYRYKKGIPFYLTCMIEHFGNNTWSNLVNWDSRNQALIRKIEEIQTTYLRIFVIAGEGHFIT